MSGASSWLQKMRKADLLELCEQVGYKVYDGLKKTEIEVGLDEYLKENSATWSGDARLQPFYKKRSTADLTSPTKKEILSDVESKVKSVKRRVTKAAEELVVATDDSEAEPTTRSRAITRTPRASALAFASTVPLPPSPAVVADAIDRNTQVLRRKVSTAFEDSGFVETAEKTRETLSTVVAVHFLVAAFEALYLRREVLADRYAFTIPAIKLLGTNPYPVEIPDMFLILTSSFWGPTILWTFTSLLIPLFAAYFFNLTLTHSKTRNHTTHYKYAFDPLTFSIVKGLLTYVIYGQDVTFGGLVDLEYVARINSAIYGGWQGSLVGTGITALITLYDAVLKK